MSFRYQGVVFSKLLNFMQVLRGTAQSWLQSHASSVKIGEPASEADIETLRSKIGISSLHQAVQVSGFVENELLCCPFQIIHISGPFENVQWRPATF